MINKGKRILNFMIIATMLILIGSAGLSAQITPPEQHFGKKPGADFFLMNYEEALEYYELIASQTDRMQIFDFGTTTEGRPMKYMVISSEENIRNLEQYKGINRKLTMARGLTDSDALELAADGRVVVWIDGGLHATEVAPAQHLAQLAYDLAAGEGRRVRAIRENVITILLIANPDGMTMVSDWYRKNLGTPYEVSRMPWLYHKYAGHDNNRDAFMANLVETQNMNRLHSQIWLPEILFNQHQTAPFPARIWIPPDAEPTNPNVHPLIIRWKNHIGTAMGKLFDEENKPGAISRTVFDTWFPGYATQVVDGHNTASILTETALYRYATPHYYTINDFPSSYRDLTVGAFYSTPWEGGWWRLGDAVSYCLTASMAVLDLASKYSYELLYDKYVMGRDGIRKFSSRPPYGWIFPVDQADPTTTALLMERMILNGVEVYEANEAFIYAGNRFDKGTLVIPANQPFAMFAKNLLEIQDYPDMRKYIHLWQGIVSLEPHDEGPMRPYDGAGWTLPLQMGVDFYEMHEKVDYSLTQLAEAPALRGSVDGGGSRFIISSADNRAYSAAAAVLADGGTVKRSRNTISAGGKMYPKGSFIIENYSKNKLQGIAESTGVSMQSGSASGGTVNVKNPRTAVYFGWTASADAGWISYIFDEYGINYHKLRDAEVRAGKLIDRFDVIILPDQRVRSIVEGNRKGTIHPNYVGGITPTGVENLKEFVREGGTLVCNKSSSDLAIDHFDLPIKNMLKGVPSDSFSCPGSILKINYDNDHPVAFGMEESGVAFFSRGTVFKIEKGENGKKVETEHEARIIAEYPKEPLLLSGWIHAEEKLQGNAAAVDVSFGEGNVLLFGFNFHNRAQAYATFKLLFNSLLY